MLRTRETRAGGEKYVSVRIIALFMLLLIRGYFPFFQGRDEAIVIGSERLCVT